MNRLAGTYPELAKRVDAVGNNACRQVALEVSKKALLLNNVSSEFTSGLIEKLEAGNSLEKTDLEELKKLIQQTEEPYLEALGNDEEMPPDGKLIKCFRQARSLDSLGSVAENDPHEALSGAVYEAIHSDVPIGEISSALNNYFGS